MDRDYPQDRADSERLDADLTEQDQDDVEDETTDQGRRGTISNIVDSVEPQRRDRQGSQASYGDTDLNPNPIDQIEEHQGFRTRSEI